VDGALVRSKPHNTADGCLPYCQPLGLRNQREALNDCVSQACKDAAAAIEAYRDGNIVALAPADEFNVAFMEGSSQAYNAAAGLTGPLTAKL